MTAVISSPYCASSARTPRPRRCLASSRCSAPTWPEPDAASNGREPSTRAGSAEVRCARTAREAAVNRRIAFSCASASNRSSPVASSRSSTDDGGQPAVERPDGVVGVYSAGNEQRAGVEQPGVAQRLEGVEEGDPAAQRHQHRAVHPALGAGHRPAQHEAVVRRPRRRAGRRCSSRRRAARRRRPGSRPTAAAADPPGSPATISLRSCTWKGEAPSTAAPARRSHCTCRASRSPSRNGFQPCGHREARDRGGPRGDRLHRRLHPPQRLDDRRDVLRPHLRLGAQVRGQVVADRGQPAATAEPGRRRGGLGLPRRSRPAAAAARRACTRRGPGGGTR